MQHEHEGKLAVLYYAVGQSVQMLPPISLSRLT